MAKQDSTGLQHVAMIMDGNGRWAKERGLPRVEGHRAGAKTVQRMVEACAKLKIPYLTLYAFSTENWQRPKAEVAALMQLLQQFLTQRLPDLHKHKVRLNAIGELDKLPPKVRQVLDDCMAATRDHSGGTLTLALSYGSRTEIAAAARTLARKVQAGELVPEAITEDMLNAHLYTADLPDPDLIIRTSGEMRLSNFLLWQASYAELWVTPTYWPDFSTDELRRAIADYNQRHRRYGGVNHA